MGTWIGPATAGWSDYLCQERGYHDVTVAEIAGLTRRAFFNYFADKREIFFGGATAFLRVSSVG